MKKIVALAIVLASTSMSGCRVDQTSTMARACQHLLERRNEPVSVTFIENAEARVESLGKTRNRYLTYLLELQDPGAIALRPELEHCVAQLKHRQAASGR